MRSKNNELNSQLESESKSFNEEKEELNARLGVFEYKVKTLEAQTETLKETLKTESQAKVNKFKFN